MVTLKRMCLYCLVFLFIFLGGCSSGSDSETETGSLVNDTTEQKQADKALELIFSEGFEDGLQPDVWNWDVDNWRGDKKIETDNPYEGDNCLFMKGSDHSANGCSIMHSKTAWGLTEAKIQIAFRDVVGLDGPGHDGYGGGDGGPQITLYGPGKSYICSMQDNYDAQSHGRTTTGNTIPQDNFFLQANQWNYDTGTKLAGLDGWHTLQIHYRSSGNTASNQGLVEIFIDDNETPILSQAIDDAPVLNSISVGAIGQYTYTGEWYIDDIFVSSTAETIVDSDNDGVSDSVDICANTPENEDTDENGCSLSQKDSDGDGVMDDVDLCNNTPEDEEVGDTGCIEYEALSDKWTVMLTETSSSGCQGDEGEPPVQVWKISQAGKSVSLTADPDDPEYTGTLNGNSIVFDDNIETHGNTVITTKLTLTLKDDNSIEGVMDETTEWNDGSCVRTYSLSGSRNGKFEEFQNVFLEDFETGLRPETWEWDRDNWRGEKTVVNGSAFNGFKSLFMKGSDHSQGGCSVMQSKTTWDLKESVVEVSFKGAKGIDGPGHDGYGGGDGGAKIVLFGPNSEYICSLQDNYDSESHGRTNTGTTIAQHSFFLQANQSNFGTGIQLEGLEGWHTLKIHYKSAEATGTGKGLIEVYLDSAEIPLLSQEIDSAPRLESMSVGVVGQYTYTGEWFVDSIAVKKPAMQNMKISEKFKEDFESGLLADIWDWDTDNSRGEKTIVHDNPYEGSNSLFMKGSDYWPGGCSIMRSKTAWGIDESYIQLSFRDVVGNDGPGHDGYGGGDGGPKISLLGPGGVSICSFQDNYDSASHGRSSTGESIKQDSLFLIANNTNYGTGISLADMSDWHTLKIHYQSAEATGKATGLVSVYLDDSKTPVLTQSLDTAPALDSIGVGVVGQYDYTGEWVIDNITVEEYLENEPGNIILYSAAGVSESEGALYTMNPDGTGRSLIPGSEGGHSARWSEDMERIVYASNKSSTGKTEIFIMNSDGTAVTQLTDYNDYYGQSNPVFFNSNEIMWTHSMGTGRSEIAVMNTDGTNARDVTSFFDQGKQANSVCLDRTNSKLIYYKQNSSWAPTGEIYISDYDFSNEQQLTNNSNCDNSPAISPDGQEILFVKLEGANGYTLPANLYSMKTDGTGLRKLTSATGDNGYGTPRWLPDGSGIVCMYSNGTQVDIIKMDTDGTNEINVTNTPDINEYLSDIRQKQITNEDSSGKIFLVYFDANDPKWTNSDVAGKYMIEAFINDEKGEVSSAQISGPAGTVSLVKTSESMWWHEFGLFIDPVDLPQVWNMDIVYNDSSTETMRFEITDWETAK